MGIFIGNVFLFFSTVGYYITIEKSIKNRAHVFLKNSAIKIKNFGILNNGFIPFKEQVKMLSSLREIARAKSKVFEKFFI